MEHSVAQRLDEGFRRVLVGTDGPIFAALVALFGGGHLLVEGVPGTAKTLLVRTLARLIGGSFRRIQFTFDLMFADVVGTTTFDPRSAQFSLRVGPISANVVLADEINRTPPKTQSALLEAMEERQVTIDGNRVAMPAPFIVAATQNPIEFEGTYPLPEAQLDRFMVKTTTDYPSAEQERDLLARANAGFDALDLDRSNRSRRSKKFSPRKRASVRFTSRPNSSTISMRWSQRRATRRNSRLARARAQRFPS